MAHPGDFAKDFVAFRSVQAIFHWFLQRLYTTAPHPYRGGTAPATALRFHWFSYRFIPFWLTQVIFHTVLAHPDDFALDFVAYPGDFALDFVAFRGTQAIFQWFLYRFRPNDFSYRFAHPGDFALDFVAFRSTQAIFQWFL